VREEAGYRIDNDVAECGLFGWSLRLDVGWALGFPQKMFQYSSLKFLLSCAEPKLLKVSK